MVDILTIGSSGLSAYRRSLEVTGNNIVNANTEGYARRDVQLKGIGDAASSPTTLLTGSGSGVAIDVIRRATDVFVQSEKRITQSASSAATALSDRLDRLEKSMFSGDGDLGKLSQTLFSRIQDFATTPSSIAVRTTVIQAANDLAVGFNVQADRLAAEADAIVSDAQSELDNLNALTKQLADLNKQIDSIGDDTGKANDLLDQRDRLIDSVVKIVAVTVESRPSGAINLYLSDGTAGPQLLGQSGAKALTASHTNGHLQITMDPYGASVPLSKIQGGTVGGIQAFDDQISSMVGQLNRMAVGFTKRFNDQHAKGTDLDGEKGLPVFSTETFSIAASKSNKGISTAEIDIGQIGSIRAGEYRATFNQSDAKWSVINTTNGTKVSGTDYITIEGMTVRFSGKPADGDFYTFSPLTNAASAMRVLIDEPRQLAASLPQLAEAVIGNQSSATIDITGTGGIVDPPPAPSISDLFSQSAVPNNSIGIKQDGVVSKIPSGSGPVSLYSLGEISAATFKIDPKALGAKSSISTLSELGPSKLTLTVDGHQLEDDIDLFPLGIGSHPADVDLAQMLADEINFALGAQTKIKLPLAKMLFASASNGFVTINALGKTEIGTTTISAADRTYSKIASTTAKSSAADINLVTREGIQLSGVSSLASRFVNEDNGFMTEHLDPQSPSSSDDLSKKIISRTYRNLQITETNGPISNEQSIDIYGNRKSIIKFDVAPEVDTPASIGNKAGTPAPGAVYSLNVDGLKDPIRLAGQSIVGKTSSDIAAMMADRLTQLAPQRSIISGNFRLPETLTNAKFSINIDGVTSSVAFTRDKDRNTGALLASGTFSVSTIKPGAQNKGTSTATFDQTSLATNGSDPYKATFSKATNEWTIINLKTGRSSAGANSASIDGIKINFSGIPSDGDSFRFGGDPIISMVPADPNSIEDLQKLVINLPKSLSAKAPIISIDGDDAKKMGLSIDNISEQIISGNSKVTALEPLRTLLNKPPQNIPPEAISLDDYNRILIKRPLFGALSSLSLTNLSVSSVDDRDVMTSAGFLGSDLTLSVDDKNLVLTSKVVVDPNSVPNLTDTSETVSRIGHKVMISTIQDSDKIPEDLLVAVQQSEAGGNRTLAATYDHEITRINPTMPDIELEVTGSQVVSIYTVKRSSSGAVQLDKQGNPQRDLIAKRAFQPGSPIDFMGAQFVIDGNASIGDWFRITTDPSRTGDNRNALALIDVGRTDLNERGSGTFADIYAAVLSKIGSSTQAAKTSAVAAKAVAENVAAAYDSATGVNLDAEAAELIKLQQAYSACAQIVSTARDMFEMILKAF